jgi:hypothetical protein
MTPYANTPHPPQTTRYSGTPATTAGGSSASAVPPGAAGISVHPQSAMFRTPATSGSDGYYGGSRPHSQVASGSSGSHNRGQRDEPTDWKRAAEAWAQSRSKTSAQQRNDFDSNRNIPRSRYVEVQPSSSTMLVDCFCKYMRKYFWLYSGASHRSKDQRRTPRPGGIQGRGTPRGMAGSSSAHHSGSRTDSSLRSVERGDATPLYDE